MNESLYHHHSLPPRKKDKSLGEGHEDSELLHCSLEFVNQTYKTRKDPIRAVEKKEIPIPPVSMDTTSGHLHPGENVAKTEIHDMEREVGVLIHRTSPSRLLLKVGSEFFIIRPRNEEDQYVPIMIEVL